MDKEFEKELDKPFEEPLEEPTQENQDEPHGEEIDQKPRKPHIGAMVVTSIFMSVCILLTIILWLINLWSIVPEDGEPAEVIGSIIVLIVVAGPVVLGIFAEAILNLITLPISFFALRKSSVKVLSLFGKIYSIASLLMLLSMVGRFLLFYFGVY
ncbi:MAG: hypothetical protein J5736_02590 [Bacilli bacterium]|nr:hypothetical protein [Bacilli bacterium]